MLCYALIYLWFVTLRLKGKIMATEFYCQYACVLSKITKKKLVKLHGESPQFPRVVNGTYIEYKVKKANSTQKLLWLVPILKLYLNWITALLLSCFARKTNVSTDFFFLHLLYVWVRTTICYTKNHTCWNVPEIYRTLPIISKSTV